MIDSSGYGCMLKLFCIFFFCFVRVLECTPYREHVSGENEEVYSSLSTVSVEYVTDFSSSLMEMKVITPSLRHGYVAFKFY